MTLTVAEAEQIVAACEIAARDAGFEVGIAVADQHGDTLTARRSETKTGLTLRLSMAKAYTAAVMRMPARNLDAWQQSKPTILASLSQLGPYPIVPGDGSMPVRRGGHVIGGVGMSGAPQIEDSLIEQVLTRLGYDAESA